MAMNTRTERNGSPGKHHMKRLADSPVSEVNLSIETTEQQPTPPPNKHLESLERKLQLIRDVTTRVALGMCPGMFVWGSGGIGKSYTVVRQLDALETNHQTLNSRVTGWGLFNHLEKYPSQVTVIEDAESMYRDPRAVGVLRSALDCQRREGDNGPIERWVTWAGDSTARKTKRVLFSGGIIVLSNAELPPRPEVEALKTRIPCLHLTATDEELRALMRSVSTRGYSLHGFSMSPAECGAVCAFIEEQIHALRSPLNMRLLLNGYAAFVQWAAGYSGTHWQDMVRSEIREQAPSVFAQSVTIRKPLGRAERKAEHHRIVREILEQASNPKDQVRLWREQTGLEQSAFYTRKAEVMAQDS